LQAVLGFGGLAGEPEAKAVDTGRKRSIKALECAEIAAASRGDSSSGVGLSKGRAFRIGHRSYPVS
jgi:hypothetical protein